MISPLLPAASRQVRQEEVKPNDGSTEAGQDRRKTRARSAIAFILRRKLGMKESKRILPLLLLFHSADPPFSLLPLTGSSAFS
jgi:hypothetical protein